MVLSDLVSPLMLGRMRGSLPFLLVLALVAPAARAQLYQPEASCRTRVHDSVAVSYSHPLTRLQRTVRIVAEEPLVKEGAGAEKLPLVLWLHGGAGGGTAQNLAEWRAATAGACYLSVTIGHGWPHEAQARALCAWMERSYPDDCGVARRGQVKLLNVERPFDVRAVIDDLLERWDGRIDPERVAVGGHSAGAGAAMMVAGAARTFGTKTVRFTDARPRAFLAFSPQGPDRDGFFVSSPAHDGTSWAGVKRPLLLGTGAGDTTSSETAANRSAVFDLLPGPNQYRLFVDDPSTPHGRFGLGRARCASAGGPLPDTDCDRVISWLKSAAVAFLDGHVRQRREALEWLREGGIEAASGGAVRWSAK